MGTENMSPTKRADPAQFEDEALTAQHGRRGPYLYIRRTRPVDQAVREAAQGSPDPFERGDVTLENLTDNDPLFRQMAEHPGVLGVMRALLGPNLVMWYDHLYGKAPYNDSGPYHGANRYHQDGFYFFSERSATCWMALDEVTAEHGCMRYIPSHRRVRALPRVRRPGPGASAWPSWSRRRLSPCSRGTWPSTTA